tara:strand:+ start:6168 stop:6347 length:180 start_codon:yes stop_codon:yes gene_type:complete
LWKYNSGATNGSDNLKKNISNTIQQRENGNEYPFIVCDKRNMLEVLDYIPLINLIIQQI